MKNRAYHKIIMIHNKGKLSAEGFKKKLLEIAIAEWYEYDGDVMFVRKGSKIAEYYVDVSRNIVEYCGIYHPKKLHKGRTGVSI